MKYVIKRSLILTVILAVLVSALICPLSAASEEPRTPATLLALGDSITTGYGLDNYVYGGDPYLCNSYINRIAAAMGLEGGDTYINRAVNGDTSGDLASLLPGIEQDVKKAEMIIITIGGNDLLRLIPEIVTMIVGQKVSNYEDAAKLLKGVPAEEYADLAADPNFQGMIFGAMVKLNANLKTISDFIKEKAPDAKVIFLKQYNPLYAPPFNAFASFAQKFLDVVNDALEKNGQTYGFDVIDLGRNVSPEAVLDCIREHSLTVVGLSALMTTTVPAMERTIALIRREAPGCRIMVGGAVLTEDMAAQIGADAYAADAMAAVRTAQRLMHHN